MKNTGAGQIFWKRDAQMCVVEGSGELPLGAIREAYGAGLDGEVCLTESASLNENLIWIVTIS